MSTKIDRGSAFDGAAITQAGIGNYAILINKEDYDAHQTLTKDGTSKEITALVLKAGTMGYKFESSKGSAQIIPSCKLRAVSAIDGFDHSLDIMALDVSELSRENIQKMRFQKVVCVIPLVSGKFMLYGANVGLRISDLEETPGDGDKGGTIKFILKTPDNDPPEISMPALIASTFDVDTLLVAAA